MRYFLGIDVGNSKSHALIVNETGHTAGYGEAGCGSPEVLGVDAMGEVLQGITAQALEMAGLNVDQVAGAGFGIAGYDWPTQTQPIREKIQAALVLQAPFGLVNDTLLGLLAGSSEGWGVAVVSGTGSNCWGLNRQGQTGRVTGEGWLFGEAGGGGDVVTCALQAVSREWSKRGPATRLTQAFLKHFGETDLDALFEGIVYGRYRLKPKDAIMVVQLAREGDGEAINVLAWNGRMLGDMACGVIRQLHLENEETEIVLIGSLYESGALLIEPMRQVITSLAPKARMVRLPSKPVVGAVVLGMQQVGLPTVNVRSTLIASTQMINWQPTASLEEFNGQLN